MAQRTYDANTEIVDIDGVSVSATTSSTGVNINGTNVGDMTYLALFNVSVASGTIDASNYFTLQLEVSDAVGGTYVAVGGPVTVTSTGVFEVAVHSEEIEKAITSADYFRVTATKTGTTATDITYGCHLAAA